MIEVCVIPRVPEETRCDWSLRKPCNGAQRSSGVPLRGGLLMETLLWCCSIAQLCPTLYNQASLSFTISQSLLKLMSIELVMLSNHLILCHPLLLPLVFLRSESFPMIQLFTSGGQSIGASASASVLPMNIQGWFPLGLTGLISLQSKGLSRVFSNTTVRKHQFFGALWCKVEHIGSCSEGAT